MQKIKPYASILLCLIIIFTSFTAGFAADITLYSNGNPVDDNTYSSGILTAVSEGEGIFAIARYKNGELINLSLAEGYGNVSMTVDGEEGVTTKVFRFLPGGTPYCVNKTLDYRERAEKRIYANESFNGSCGIQTNGTTLKHENNRLTISGKGTQFYTTVSAYEVERYVIAEATFSLPDTTAIDVKLISVYNGYSYPLVSMKSGSGLTDNGGIYTQDNSEIKKYGLFTSKDELKTGITVSVVIDTVNKTYDTYFNGEKKDTGASLTNAVGEVGNNLGFLFGIPTSDNTTIYLDDVKIYSTSDGSFMDLGDEIPNVHKADFPLARLDNAIYERPDYKTIASLTSAKNHPRIMLNDAKIDEIKNSVDTNIQRWKAAILADADELVNTIGTYNYITQDITSIGGIGIGVDYVMTLGMAYNLTGDTKYVTRAYKEVMALNSKFPTWGDRKALSVGEASVMHAICYDWMYDALTAEQKNNLKTIAMKQALTPAYKTYHGQYVSDIAVDINRWWNNTNNWNPVCNGGFIVASLAFMEADMYTCSNLAEACLRGIEHAMGEFAPDGAWSEGVMYWGYAMKYLTAAMASFETCCGSLYGIEKAEGFDKTSLYGLALEGKTGGINFGDASSNHVKAPFMFYWSRIFDEEEYTAAALYSMDIFGFEPNAFDLIYYDSKMNDAAFSAPESYYVEGTEVVSITSGLKADDTFIAMSGGLGSASNHDHLDSGAVIVEKNGERLFSDIGAEHYSAGGYFDIPNKYKLFRARPEAHNIFIINPEKTTDTDDTTEYFGQYLDAESKVTAYDKTNKTATMNLDAAYARDASAASRTISLEGDNAVITDSITLKASSDVYWNWYIKVPMQNIVLSADKKSATVTLNGESFNISFEASCSYTLDVQEAVQYVDTEPNDSTPRHSNDKYRRLVVKFADVNGTISLKTIVK